MSRTLFTLLLLVGSAALAQDKGSIRITGRVAQMASLRFHSGNVAGEGVTGRNDGADNALNYTLDLGDVGLVEGRNNGVRGASVTLALRANASYVLTATVTGSGFQQGPGEIGLSDIGFGLPSSTVVPSGDRARVDGLVAPGGGKFDSDPLSAAVGSGQPSFRASLADLENGPVPILQGDRISYGGAMDAPNNALLVTTHYAVQPQYFQRNDGFEAVITYTLTTP